MVQQSDWTVPLPEEPKSYPGTLRGYRDFLDLKDSLNSGQGTYTYLPIAKDQWWKAECNKKEAHDDEAPKKECTCGFYVNYYTTETFYPSYPNRPRGVVEASGRIVLARKGFRAEKLRLVALCTPYAQMWKYIEGCMPHVDLFFDKEDMYDKYPQDDLTSLIGSEESRRKSTADISEWTYVGNAINSFSVAAMDMSTALISISPVLSNTALSNFYLYNSYVSPQPSYASGVITVDIQNTGGQLVINGADKSILMRLAYNNTYQDLEKFYFDSIVVQHTASSPAAGAIYEIFAKSPKLDMTINATLGTYTMTQKI